MPSNEQMLTIGLAGMGVYFTVANWRSYRVYLLFRQVQGTALLTWPGPRPAHFKALLAMGALASMLTIVNSALGRPFHHVYGQAVMALYFVLAVPLVTSIPVGFYRDGVWTDGSFLPWGQIRQLTFRETPELVLILLPRSGLTASVRLQVPPTEYGAVRKVLEEKRRAQELTPERSVLHLDEAGPA